MLGAEYPHYIRLNRTQWGYSLDLDLGRPTQWTNGDTFAIDTTTPMFVTATERCTDCDYPWEYPVYNMTNSTSCKQIDSAGAEVSCNEIAAGQLVDINVPRYQNTFKGYHLKDRVCLSARLFRICANDVPFYGIVGDSE